MGYDTDQILDAMNASRKRHENMTLEEMEAAISKNAYATLRKNFGLKPLEIKAAMAKQAAEHTPAD